MWISYRFKLLYSTFNIESAGIDMPEELLKRFSIDIQKKLYENQAAGATVAVFQTQPFGKLLTLNGEIIISEQDSFCYHEMMAHPALFAHPNPQKIIILGHYAGIMNEILKHDAVTQIICVQDNPLYDGVVKEFFPDLHQAKHDTRVSIHTTAIDKWLTKSNEAFDIIIDARLVEKDNIPLQNFSSVLHEQGILVQSCPSILLHFEALKNQLLNLQHVGFADWQLLNFPQPSYLYGFRSVCLAWKNPSFKRVPEKKIFNRTFRTRYYNLDTHKAALMLPEFMRELAINS